MPSPISIECPHCSQTLKLKNPKLLGRKVPCPKCKTPFVLEEPEPEGDVFDEFDDFGDDYSDDYGDDEFDAPPPPRKRRAAGGGKGKGKKSKKSGRPGWVLPVAIGGGVLGIAAIVALVIWGLGGDGDAPAVADNSDANGVAAPEAVPPAGMPGGPMAPGSGPGGPMPPGAGPGGGPMPPGAGFGGPNQGGGQPNPNTGAPGFGGQNPGRPNFGGPNPGGQPTAANTAPLKPNPPSQAPEGGVPLDLRFLPADSEAVAVVRIGAIWNSKAVQDILANPMVKDAITDSVPDDSQISLEDLGKIESVTLGASGITAAAQSAMSGGQPNPNLFKVAGVLRVREPIPILQNPPPVPGAQQAQFGGATYQKVANPLFTVAWWMADPKTMVIGTESAIQEAIQNTSTAPTRPDLAFVDAKSEILLVMAPAGPDLVFRNPLAQIPNNGPPGVMGFLRAVHQNARAASVGLTLSNTLSLDIAVRSMSTQGLSQLNTTAGQLVAEGQQAMNMVRQSAPPSAILVLNMGDQLLKGVQLKPQNDVMYMSTELKNANQSLPILFAMVLPAIQQAREAARKSQSLNNLKQLALSHHNHHDVYKSFPKPAILDDAGKPLLSWRVAILPFIGEDPLYKKFHLDEPWDSPHNKSLIPEMPALFALPAQGPASEGRTPYQVVRGPGALFELDEGPQMRQITDGLSNTILIVEADQPVVWTQPVDFTPNTQNPAAGLGKTRKTGFQAALADGSVRFFDNTLDPATLKALFTRNGGEVVNFR